MLVIDSHYSKLGVVECEFVAASILLYHDSVHLQTFSFENRMLFVRHYDVIYLNFFNVHHLVYVDNIVT